MRVSTCRRSRFCVHGTCSAVRCPFVPSQDHSLLYAGRGVSSIVFSWRVRRIWMVSHGNLGSIISQSHHTHRTCRTTAYLPSATFCFLRHAVVHLRLSLPGKPSS